MEEKILVQSKRCKLIGFVAILCLVGLVLGIILSACLYGPEIKPYSDRLAHSKQMYQESQYKPWLGTIARDRDKLMEAMKPAIFLTAGCFSVMVLMSAILYFAWSRMELVVSDKRVYGKAAFGKRVDLPNDSVSAISSKWPKGISVATSSGRISFLMVKNRDDIYQIVNDLLIKRQTNTNTAPVATSTPAASNADEIKKYKELLDMGVISQEEFDAKKKQLLGL